MREDAKKFGREVGRRGVGRPQNTVGRLEERPSSEPNLGGGLFRHDLLFTFYILNEQ